MIRFNKIHIPFCVTWTKVYMEHALLAYIVYKQYYIFGIRIAQIQTSNPEE